MEWRKKFADIRANYFNFRIGRMQRGCAADEVRHRLDYEIPAYLSRLRRDINEFLDPKYEAAWSDPRLLVAERIQRDAETGIDTSSQSSAKS